MEGIRGWIEKEKLAKEGPENMRQSDTADQPQALSVFGMGNSCVFICVCRLRACVRACVHACVWTHTHILFLHTHAFSRSLARSFSRAYVQTKALAMTFRT